MEYNTFIQYLMAKRLLAYREYRAALKSENHPSPEGYVAKAELNTIINVLNAHRYYLQKKKDKKNLSRKR